MNEQTYKTMELNKFNAQDSAFFDNIADFQKDLSYTWIKEQIEWIENGSYGAGACLALSKAIESKRGNPKARAGQVILKAFNGSKVDWNKLNGKTQGLFNKAVNNWLNKSHDFALTMERN